MKRKQSAAVLLLALACAFGAGAMDADAAMDAKTRAEVQMKQANARRAKYEADARRRQKAATNPGMYDPRFRHLYDEPKHHSLHKSDYIGGLLEVLLAVSGGSSSSGDGGSYDSSESYERSEGRTVADDYFSAVYAEEVLALCNAERAKAGVSPLRLSSELQRVAKRRADEIVKRFSHTRWDGKDVNGWFFSSDPHVEENLAGGYDSPQAVVAGWMADAERRAIILDPASKEMGLGFHEDENGMYRYYWAQLLRG